MKHFGVTAMITIMSMLLVVLAFPVGAQQESLVIRMAFLPGDANAQPFYADDMGFFKEAHIDARFDTRLPGREVLAAIEAGRVDVGFSNMISVAHAIEAGEPVVLLCGANTYDTSKPLNEMVQSPSTNYRTGKDLNGKRIASPSGAGSLGALGPEIWIDRTGGDSKTVQLVTTIPLIDVAEALASGQVDAAEVVEPYRTILLEQGKVKHLASTYALIAPHFQAGVWVASKKWIEANPEAARRFVTVMTRTAKWANTHRDETATLLSRRLNVPMAITHTMNRAVYTESLDPKLMQILLDVAAQHNLIKPIKAEQLIVKQAIPETAL